jgi:cytidyltransferase-like protein
MNKFDAIQQKVRGLQETARQVEKWQMAGEKVVFTNGCFDILHAGHVTYLAKAADFGTKLVIGLNTDLSVKRLLNNTHTRRATTGQSGASKSFGLSLTFVC